MYNTSLHKNMKYSGIGLYGGSTELFSLHIIPRTSKMSSMTPNFLFSDPYYFKFCTTHSFLRYDNQGKFLTNKKHWAKLHPPSIAISVKKHHKITKPFFVILAIPSKLPSSEQNDINVSSIRWNP